MSISPDRISLSPEQQQHLARLAKQCGKPWDTVFEEALSSFEQTSYTKNESNESVYSAMVRLGLLGSVKDGPTDLSTNPAYMEGFGQREQ